MDKIEWIEFTVQKPNNNQIIKVKSEDYWHGEGIFQDDKFIYSWVKGACFGSPTHWMPLTQAKGIEPSRP